MTLQYFFFQQYIVILKHTGKDDLDLFGENYWGDFKGECICIEIMLHQTDMVIENARFPTVL